MVILVGSARRGARRHVFLASVVVAALLVPGGSAGGAEPPTGARRSAGTAPAVSPDHLDALRAEVAAGGTARVLATFTVDGSTRAAAPSEPGRRGAIATRAVGLSRALEVASPRSAVVRTYSSAPVLAAVVDAAGLESLVRTPGLAGVRSDRMLRPQVARGQLVQSVPQINAAPAYAAGHTGAGERIAVIDSGVDNTHPMLAGKVVGQACYSTTYAPVGSQSVCPGGVDSDTTGGGPCPAIVIGCEHGTHVAGIAAGAEWDPPGAQPVIRGVAYDAQVHSVQVFSRFNSWQICFPEPAPCAAAWESDIIAGFDRVLDLTATVDFAAVNVSIGGDITPTSCPGDPSAPFIQGITAAGVPVVIASGNDGFYDAIAHPSCVPGAIAVASVDGADEISFFANTSKWLQLLAPGEQVVSAIPGGVAASFNGTSMAAPHVAGAITLLGEAQPGADVPHLFVALRKGGKPVFDPYSKLTFRRIDVGGALDAYHEDITKPVPTMHWMPALSTSPRVPISWSATDEPGGSGIGRFDVLKRTLRWDGWSSQWKMAISDSVATKSNPATTAGWTKCYRVRARDLALNQSLWTPSRCTASPLDDRALVVKTAGWANGTSSNRYLGTMRSAWSPGRHLSRPGIVAQRIWLVVTTCARCGTAAVFWNGSLVKVVDLRAPTTKHQQLIGVFASSTPKAGTLDIITLDSGIVSIDGLGVSRS